MRSVLIVTLGKWEAIERDDKENKNMRNSIVKITLCAAASLLAFTTFATASRPNIVLILCDDLGYGDVQCLNPENGKIQTPHVDKLASEGMTFTDAHSAASVCTPSAMRC